MQVLTGLRTSVTTNFELRDTVSMLRDQAGAEMTSDNVEYIGNLGTKMISEMDKIIASKDKFLEAIAKADQIALQTVEAASKSIPIFQ